MSKPDRDREEGNAPVVTIGLPVLNGENYLAETIESIRAQTFSDFELVIADNGSTDGTAGIVASFVVEDPRIRVASRGQTVGAHHNYNSLVPLARGKYFKWAAHDDLMMPTFLERCVEVLDERPEVVLAHPKIVIIDGEGNEIGRRSSSYTYGGLQPSERFRRYIGDRNRSEPTFGVHRLEVLASTPLLGHFPGSDWILLAELALRGEFVEVDEELFLNRNHAGRSTKATVDSRFRGHWFDPDRTTPIPHHWHQLAGYADAIARVPLVAAERRRCDVTLGKWAVRHTRDLVTDLWVSLRFALTR